MSVVSVTRAERAAEAARLRASGLSQREIAERMGIGRSYAAALLSDPDGAQERARKESYRGVCEGCGAPTDGSNGRAGTPRYCRRCFGRETRLWTRETVIAAIRAWAARHGRPPRARPDWLHASPDHPSATTVYSGPYAPFRSWADAIEAAGFPRPRVGYYQDESSRSEKLRVYSDEDILSALRTWATVHGEPPSYVAWRDSGLRPSPHVMQHRFGSWRAALERAGL